MQRRVGVEGIDGLRLLDVRGMWKGGGRMVEGTWGETGIGMPDEIRIGMPDETRIGTLDETGIGIGTLADLLPRLLPHLESVSVGMAEEVVTGGIGRARLLRI